MGGLQALVGGTGGGLQWQWRARWEDRTRQESARRPGGRELAGTFGCPMDGSDTGVAVRQEVESLAAAPWRG